MKSKLKVLAALAFLAILSFSCVTSPKNTAAKLIASTSVTVDNAMKGWATYVTIHGVSSVDQLNVRTLYQNYQQSMAVAKVAYTDLVTSGNKTAWQNASTALEDSVKLLLNILTEQQLKKTPH